MKSEGHPRLSFFNLPKEYFILLNGYIHHTYISISCEVCACTLKAILHIHRNEIKKNALKPMNAFTYMPKPKSNAETNMCTNSILFFQFQRPYIARTYTRFLFSITRHDLTYTAHTQTRAFYIIAIMEAM